MDNVRHIGIRPIPDDADIAKFLQETNTEYQVKLDGIIVQLNDTLNETMKENQPPIFALAKLLNYLAKMEKPELIELLSAALWKDVWG